MPEEKDKIKKLYDTFVSDGYDMESEEEFRKNLLDSTKRKAAYDALVKDGYDMEPFEEFESNIGFGKERASSQQSGNSASRTVEEPILPANEQTWQPTEKEKVAMLTETDRIMNDVKSHTQTFNERIDNMQEYGINPGLQTKEGKMIFNPESGKLEKTFLTPAGNRYYSKSLADMESFQYRQAADMSIGGQLRKANLRLQELKAKQAERASEVHKEWAEETENNKAPLAAILGAATYTPRQQSDKENRALSVAIRETEELIKNLEEQKDRENGVDVGFWRGFGRTMGDVRTWDFGMGDMRDAFTMMNADELKKENATEGEREAHDAMMGAIHEKQQAEERYSGNADFWNRAGVMTGYMPSFMLDFVLTGGGFNGLSSFSKGSTRLATKVISKETAEKMAQQGFKSYIKENGAKGLGRYATDWTIKALGTTADDLLVRAPLMANTVQAGKTTADIIDRKLGDVVVDENGNYDFSNDKTWGDAIWQSEANAIIENYSEMFGAHLDPVFTLGNMSKLANVVGAKRIGAVLSKADASALNGIMGQTHQMFNKMGMSDYVGEVSEEYYGQLWRTMLNLDDAYQQNPDGTRINLFASGQFHGDIWGGMALSMGLMGAGKHTLSAANYTSMKHGVNKADAKVNELLGKEVWEPLKVTLDLTTNENIGEVAELIAGDKDFTINEKAAVLDYMERSLNLRGFNLASMAQSRGGNRNESVQQANDSYLDGYNIISSQEMNDAKNMYEYQRARVADLVDESMFAMIEENPIAALEFVNGNEQWNDEDKVSVIDYINAKQVYNGMIQRVRDDIDGRIEQSNSMIDARVNHNTGMIQGATMKQDERKVYVISGKLVPYDDGSGVSVTDSDNSIIIRDSETGALEQVSPDAVLSLDESQDPNEQKELAEQAIVEQFAHEAADKIDSKVTFNPGDAYTITGQDGSQMQVQIIANEDGIVDNGDGTVNVSDGVNIFPLAKETIQQQADAANLARVAQFEQQRTIENAERKQEMQEAERPQYALNDIVSLTDENGVTVRGNITADADADGKYEVFTEAPINGKRVNLFTRVELDNMLLEHNGVVFERPAENESNNGAENIPENDNNAPQNIPAMQRIPKDEQGNPLYEQADSDTAWDAIVEQTKGDEDMAQTVADGMVADKEEALKKLEKAKSKGGNSIAEKIASEKERKATIDAAKQDLLAWQKIAGTANRRRMAADAERKRMADEAAALRKAEEEKLRAEREEAERVEREALNGVPDMVDDTPQDARARGYRRVNGHKIDRQEPLQTVQGKEVNVKFSNDVLAPGRVAVIDASLLQPSHIQGVRNPLHFIDEAQPKERNDEASVLSARKIAGNIRPEEITSSITAYTGAPTVNERGEVIQGNNRSDALRLMWESHPEQAEAYRQYLKDHAEEFGLRAEDIAALQSPVLVNMLHVDDATAIPLGQYVAQDTESGGVERIKPKNALQRMGIEVRSFANLLLRASDDEVSFAGLVDANGASVLKWMTQRGFISPTQYKSAFDSKGNLTPEAKNDLRGIMYQSIFKDGSTRLEEMFNVLPVKAQKAILATAFRDYDSPNSERMVDEIQNSVRAYYALSQDKMFAEAKNFKEARTAVESWKRQYQMDDVTGESYLPADNFSNFVLHLAAMYKGESQSFIQNTFGKIYDLIQGTQEETLFEQPDNTPRTLVQAIKEALNLDYNGQQRNNVLVGDTTTSQRGQQGSSGNAQTGERTEDGNGTTDSGGRVERNSGRNGVESEDRGNQEKENDETEVIGRSMTADEAQDFIADMELSAEIAPEIDLTIENWDALFGEDGIVSTPIGNVKMGENQFTKLMRQGRNGKLGMIKPTLEHPHAIVSDVSEAKEGDTTERASSYVFIRSFKKADDSRYYYFTSITVSKDGKEVVVSNQEKRRNAIANLLTKGKMVWKHADDVSDASDMAQGLYSPQGNVSDLATEGTDAPQTQYGQQETVVPNGGAQTEQRPADVSVTASPENLQGISDSKGTNNSRKSSELGEKIAAAEAEVDVNPTEAQKEAGNYKKGHVLVGVFDITIEQPKGSVRSGVDANGNKWETTMQNTYGYIRGTEGVDGDHIDVFLSDDIDGWNGRRVFVVDQYNEDGSFDEHKVMLGFNETDDAEAAYFANYDSDWANNHKTVVTAVNLEDFEKWIDSSHRKTKAFAEYKSVKSVEEQSSGTQVDRLSEIKSRIEELHKEQEAAHGQSDIFEEARIISEINGLFAEQRKLEQSNSNEETTTPTDAAYTITPAQYTTKRGKVLDMQIVKFGMELSKDEFRSANAFAKSLKGWYDAKQRGFLMRSEDDAKQLVDAVIPKEDAALSVTQSEDSENAVENTPQAGEDIFQMAERIAKEEEEKRRASKENARKAEEAGKEPVSLEHWKRMNGDARMAEAGKRPLTREEIESASTDEVLKANALDYLDGNQGMIQSISYLKVYEDVRYPNRTAAADSGATDSAQLDTPALGNEQRVDVRDRGQSGNSNARLDRETSEEGVPAEGGPLHADPSDARSDATGNGNGGSETVPVRESVLQPGDSQGDVHSGSSVRSGEGRNVGGRTGRKSSTTSRKNSKRGVQADTARNAKNDRGLDLNDPLDKELADALKEFDSVLDEFNRAGREELSMSLVGMNSRQMEVLPQLVSAGAKVGYAYIKKGAHNFAEWAKRMREALGSKLKDAGLGENEIDAFIKEMWKSKLPMDGEVHTVEEWAGIIGKVELRKKVGESLEEKRKAQRAAEPIPVKTCDRENIVETLPFLLPQQQDDVLKAETQFFDESHNDREHAFGKGYMFTNGTGTGKTYTGLGIVKRFIKQGKGRILILTPSQTKVKDWIEDAANLDIELNDLDKTAKARKDGTTAITEKGEGAVITTYANFRQNKALLEDLFDLIVYDESHRLLENKGGVGTTGSMQHYKLSNRNEQFAFLRLQDINPTWNELNAKNEEFSTQRDAIIKRIEKESGTTNELTLGQRGELPPVFNGNWTQGMEQKFPELAKLRNECLSLDAKYTKEVKPELERQAKENVKHTKVVFLSATPFNTRENLDYVEGYIFSYPEKEKQDGYSTQSPRSQFYLEHFGAGYKWRYHRLESSGSNPEAVSKQEVEFSNYLQHTLQTISGRIIDSPFDYSRDFPTVTLDKAEEFNNAMEELSRNKATSYAYHEVMGDYNYTSALFESMKVTQIIPRLKEHFARGRKAVIFHRRVESKNPLVPPFKTIFDVAVQSLKEEYDATKKAENKKEIARLRRKYAGMLEWEQTLDLRMPREQLADAFGKNNVLFFSGKESKKIKDKAVEDFNNDASGKNVIVIQEDSGKEGISLHDTTGQHQRVLVTLALPQSPITALQIEGRIYRIGNKSNAIFEYPLLGLNTELMLFGQKFNQQVSTTENLALGSQARNLRESFARGVEEHSRNVDIDNQGVGGKEFDTPSHTETDAFDGTVLDYYTNQKLSGRRDSREGQDYYPTPEPLGYMMALWGRIGEGESVLEPSAGHGAIARYVPLENQLTAVEPSQSLFSKLQLKAGGNGRKFENDVFENYHMVNKHDVVLMNPPFGTGGKLAVEHVAKAFQHLEEGGRIVAIIPRGSADKKFDKWYEDQKDAVLTAEIGLPDITFERAGTSVNCRVVVIDKVTNETLRQDAASRAVHMDLSGDHYEKIEDFFEEIRNIDVPERTIDHKAKLKKKAAPTARELRTVKGINYVNLTEDGISVSGRGVWGGLEWKDKAGKALTDYLADQYRIFKSNYDYAVRDGRETQEAAYGEMKELACKLAGMTEDEMQRYIDKRNADDTLYRSDDELEEVNERFNDELRQQINGTLPKGHVYQLGNPSDALLNSSIPDLPIELAASRLSNKSMQENHPFDLPEVEDLPKAIQNPLAVFRSATHIGSFVVMTEIEHKGKNFVVAIQANKKKGRIEINDIRSVHYRTSNAHMANWIVEGLLEYTDKKRMAEWLSKQRYNSAEVRKLFNHATKIVENFENPKIADENMRERAGAYTDDELSYENDPVAKLLGQSRRTAKQRREFAQRERQRMAERVESLAEKLHLDNVEVVTDASVLDGKKQRAKGIYSKSTGKITIVIPNHTSTFDVEQTLLHEAVAHYGLRQLFGEHFDTFLDNVFNNADENIRRRITDIRKKLYRQYVQHAIKGVTSVFEQAEIIANLPKSESDFTYTATEEYLASLAEDTEFENINASWWRQIKDFFLNMLHKIGFEDFRGVTLSDNELRYILWRSYENLAEPGRYRNILGEAADVAKQYELKVGNYAVSDPHHLTVAESDDALYRTGDPEIHERELARDRYERRVKSGMFQSREALQDSMLGLKEAMTAILGKETNIEDVDGFENAYLGENRLSSVNKAEADAFAHTLFKPMLDEVAKLARTEADREELTDYMMAKHGLERNTYMRNEAINNGATDADQTDYAGLTALTGMDNITDAETEAQIMVNDYEQAHDTTDLWKKVNAASKAILSKSYECGMMSKATFDKISDMYDFYIPLRGFDEKTSSEAYAYLTHKQSAFNAPIKKAEGRRSKADDPFANLQSMAEGAIMQGNRNKLVKQRFLNFALNHSSDLVSVSDIWVEYDTVADEWKPVFPDNIDSTDTPEVVERKMLDFETKMESLAQQYPDRYKHGKDTVNIPYRIVESRDMRQHQIVVKRGGRDYVITINGNPRAAQALNGQTNPDNDMSGAIGAILRAGENINRQLSAFYTTRNPDFIVSNFMRDMLYTNTMTWIRESPNYALRFHRNYMYANPVRIKQLLAKHRKGTLDMSNKTEAMFHQFMMNGGETGYANIRDIEQHKNDIRRELKKSNGKIPVKKAWDLLGERFDEYNQAVENCARFAAFMTSREMGRSIDRAIYDAKEISVNFNKKGSGAKFYDSTGQTKAGNASALVSGLGRSGYVFWNAAIQGTANFGRQMKRHPAKAFTGIAAMFLLGAIVAYLGGDDDDDDDKNAYYNLPEYVRRSNILFRAGNSWVSIPLPVEYRAVYGMGELMISVLNGKEHLTGEEIAEAITGQATQILPIDFLEGGGGLNAFVPSAYKPLWEAYVAEKSWTGMPLYKDTPYNKDMPEWTKAYKSANKYIVGLANAMNEATGGDPYTKGTIDFNPAKIEYMLNGYFGGVFGTIDKLSKTAETITDNREYDPRSFLLVNRLVKAGDERTEYRAVNNEYFRLKEEHDRLKSRLKHYEEDTDNDIFDYAEKIDFLYNSPEYERYEIFEDYRRDIDDLYNELNDTVDDEERKNIEAELNELKKEMIEEMNKTRK